MTEHEERVLAQRDFAEGHVPPVLVEPNPLFPWPPSSSDERSPTVNVYVVTADIYDGGSRRWVVGVYADEAKAQQVAGDFPDLRAEVQLRTVDERTAQ